MFEEGEQNIFLLFAYYLNILYLVSEHSDDMYEYCSSSFRKASYISNKETSLHFRRRDNNISQNIYPEEHQFTDYLTAVCVHI